jgi:hypothetical protein
MTTCTRCDRPGTPYEYHGQTFDGLTAYHGERLCGPCTDGAVHHDGVTIRLVNPNNGDTDVINTADVRRNGAVMVGRRFG